MSDGLSLTRKADQSVNIILEDGRKIVVKVAEIRGRQVRLRFYAPGGIKILRDEIME